MYLLAFFQINAPLELVKKNIIFIWPAMRFELSSSYLTKSNVFQLLPLPQRFIAFSDETATTSASNNQSADRLDNGNELEENPEEDFREATELRGNLYWAPPRPQLILKIHKNQRYKFPPECRFPVSGKTVTLL